ncbi:hypothetical protein SERLA73DRAFT_177985 [Serpula lacrymans var. lacrymans S7.3]|uniref:Uncharacterized protein n=1 Tax=Serpula lacrymans var. lacrymans (strain S7.3) TaxID=936435 RepID=F8PQ78_SERL3|nr:hypothetical protein SERLA73DRAFT_177985 [Serpula lacrymans var. lacrymans S7.3]
MITGSINNFIMYENYDTGSPLYRCHEQGACVSIVSCSGIYRCDSFAFFDGLLRFRGCDLVKGYLGQEGALMKIATLDGPSLLIDNTSPSIHSKDATAMMPKKI